MITLKGFIILISITVWCSYFPSVECQFTSFNNSQFIQPGIFNQPQLQPQGQFPGNPTVFGPQTAFQQMNIQQQRQNLRLISNLEKVDWSQIDRRAEEGWWHLYPFGERYMDIDIGDKPWKDFQIDLDFYFPYYGFRFNYTFIYPEGFVAFDRPQFIQPPYTYPNPRWPDEPDPSFIASLLMAQGFAHVGEHRLSHVWYRIVTRPELRFRVRQFNLPNQGPNQVALPGRMEDPALLNQITRDIREGMVGTRGFTANFALIITWERMGYGGQPRFLRLNEYEQIKRYLNTYQLILTSDEIRSYVVMNYAHVNYSSSAEAGALFGRGGVQSALVGFNGGNGTGFYEMPYSGQGDLYKLVSFGATETAGRWLARVDEAIQYGGCTNASNGPLQMDGMYVNMIGGMVFNVSGPCFRPQDYITMEVDEEIFDCGYTSLVKATCVVPYNMVFKLGFVTIQITQDGRNYAWVRGIYMFMPSIGTPGGVTLLTSVSELNPWQHDWNRHDVDNLTIRWAAANISSLPNARVDINLFGYWEDVIDRDLVKVGSIARGIPNTGIYAFNPRLLQRNLMTPDSWKKFWGGVVQVHVSDHSVRDRGDRLYWSKMVPFAFYFRDVWRENYGAEWALHLCIQWFEYDGMRENFYPDVETNMACPCTLAQAVADFGRFVPLAECDMQGDSSCYYTRGAQHCVLATISTVQGATQMCCYDFQGWLIFSHDYEFFLDYLKYASAGVAYRAHPWGGYRYKKPPHVPSWSNFYNDLLPYDVCCRWAAHCEFYYWRRMTSGCQNYKPPKLATVYGFGHFITFDNVKYTFNGRGYFVLVSFKTPRHELMVQIRMEQPPKTLYDTHVPATVVTGVVAQDNGSSVVEVYARKEFRRWRYKTDVYADGNRVFFDRVQKKYQHFNKVAIHSPHLNMNQSELNIMFATGVGVKVLEMWGYLQVVVSLPPDYNETAVNPYITSAAYSGRERCASFYRTLGLFGTYNDEPADDLTSPECNIIRRPPVPTEFDNRQLFYDFGSKWSLGSSGVDSLFDSKHKPLYYPALFTRPNWEPMFDPWRPTETMIYESLIFSRDEEVRFICQSVFSCMFDYLVSARRHEAVATLEAEKKFEGLKLRGEQKLKSCGPLQRNKGVIKFPIGNNYLDGVTVTFSCQVEYFLHGEQQRRCINGTWSRGWWAWCRERNVEHGLKWMTGLVVSIGLLSLIVTIFMWLHRMRKMKEKLDHPDWVAHRKAEQERRKVKMERKKEESRLKKLAKKLQKHNAIAPMEELSVPALAEDPRAFVHPSRNRFPTVSETVDRPSGSEISLTPEQSVRGAESSVSKPSSTRSRRIGRQRGLYADDLDYWSSNVDTDRQPSMETLYSVMQHNTPTGRRSSSETTASRRRPQQHRQLPTVHETTTPSPRPPPDIVVTQWTPREPVRRAFETTF